MKNDFQNQNRYFSEKQAAEYIGLSHKTLQRLRANGEGMPFIRARSRILYDQSDLDAYMQGLKIQSTSAYGGQDA